MRAHVRTPTYTAAKPPGPPLDGKTESARISIASNIWWKAHVEYDGGGEWLEITPAEGFGDIEITIATERNYDLSTPKTARLVIVSDDPALERV